MPLIIFRTARAALLGAAIRTAPRAIGVRAKTLLSEQRITEIRMGGVKTRIQHRHRDPAPSKAQRVHLVRLDQWHTLGEVPAAPLIEVNAPDVGIGHQLAQAALAYLTSHGTQGLPAVEERELLRAELGEHLALHRRDLRPPGGQRRGRCGRMP
jgi:hypothetical protein